jgi:hypothetical protein
MNLSANKAQLAALTKELSLQWENTKTYWKDSKSEEFGRRYLEQLLLLMEKAGDVCDRLEKLTTKVRNDCE